MTNENIIKLADKTNKEILLLSEDIKKDVKHLPDFYAVERIKNNIEAISALQYKLEILKTVLT